MKRVYLELIKGKTIGKEHQADFKKDALNIEMLLYEECTFQDFECDTLRDADYKACTFRNMQFYWTLFNLTQFTNCSFINCTFQGVTFADCTFLECHFTNCKFTPDKLGRKCYFDNISVSKCKIDQVSSIGFNE